MPRKPRKKDGTFAKVLQSFGVDKDEVKTPQKAKAKKSETAAADREEEAESATPSSKPVPRKRKPRKKAAEGSAGNGAKPKTTRKPRAPRTNRKTTGDGGGGPNVPGSSTPTPRKRAPAKPKATPVPDENGNIPIKRGRGRPRGSRGTTYRKRKRAPSSGTAAEGTGGAEQKSIPNSNASGPMGQYLRGLSPARRGMRGGGRPRGRGRGRGGRGGGMGRVQATKERNRALRERMLMEGEEESHDEFETFEELDTAYMLASQYDNEGELLLAETTVPARCPYSVPMSERKTLDVGRRGRKRRLAVEKEEVHPVQSLFKKITRMSVGLASKDHEQKIIVKANKLFEDFRTQVANINNKSSEANTIPGSTADIDAGMLGSLVKPMVTELNSKIWAYFVKHYTDSTTSLTNDIMNLLLVLYRKHYSAVVKEYPITMERIDEVVDFVMDGTNEVYKGIAELGRRCSELRFTVTELMEEITIAEAEKNMQIDILEILQASSAVRKPEHLDETCIWGLKPLRVAFSPPYFKGEGDLTAAPQIFAASQFDRDAIFNVCNQKWTPRDMTQLRMSIREAIIERQAMSIEQRAEEMIHECNDIRDRLQYMKRLAQVKKSGLDEDPDNETEQQLQPLHFPKKRGRPKKDPIYAQIRPHLLTIRAHEDVLGKDAGFKDEKPLIVARYVCNNVQIRDWRNKTMDQLSKQKFEQIVLDPRFRELVDWDVVATKVMMVTRKIRTTNDCRLAFEHNANPTLKKKWTSSDVAKLLDILKDNPTLSWLEVSNRFNGQKTEFTCFFRWRCQKDSGKRVKWDQEKDKQLLNLAIQFRGNWKKVAAEISDHRATKNQVIERYKKKVNPILKNGAFDRVEDSLLLLALEKLKGHMNREGHFGELTAYLPWRYESTWRDRAGNVFADWVVPWTLDEDRKLMQYVVTMKRSWKHIACQFNSFKNRKGCLTRYKILEKGLQNYGTLENYHETYAMTRYNTFQCEHLDRVLDLLKRVLVQPSIPFAGLSARRPPTEGELQSLLLSYNRTIVAATIKSVETYLASRNKQWVEWIERYGKKQRTFDRRTFHAEIPQSVASAIHIRGVRLKPKTDVPNLTAFQKDVYLHYGRFRRTKALKKDAVRRYLPTGSELLELKEIRNIVDGFELDRCPTPPPTEKQVRGRYKRKLGKPVKVPAAKKNEKAVAKPRATPGRGRPRKKKVMESDSETEEDEPQLSTDSEDSDDSE